METHQVKKIDIEGSLLSVCPNCVKFGKEPEKPKQPETGPTRRAQPPPRSGSVRPQMPVSDRLEQRKKRMQPRNIYSASSEMELIDDYHKEIQRARMELGMNQEELARKLNERKSIIAKLETKSIKPDNKLIRKLEKTLKITLMENVE